MQIQVITVKADGTGQQDSLPKPNGQPLVMRAQANTRMTVMVDGVKQTGNELIEGKKTLLKRAGDSLLLLADGETLLEITDFYADANVVLDGGGWSFAATDGLTIPIGSQGVMPDVTLVGGATSVPSGISLGGLIAGGMGIGVLAASSGTSSLVPSVKSVDTIISGQVMAGPIVSTNKLMVEILDAKGVLIKSGNLNSDGTYSVNIGAYTGPVIARIKPDADSDPDFRNEADKALKDLNATLMGVTEVKSGGNVLNINPATTVAARDAGLSNEGDGVLVAGRSIASNAKVAAALGLQGSLTETVPEATVTVDGSDITANDYGKILAALSGIDVANGGAMGTTIQYVLDNIVGSGSGAKLSADAVVALIQGAKAANVSPVAVVTLLVGSTVDDNEVTSLKPETAPYLTAAQIQTIDFTKIADSTLALLDPVQLAQALSADQVAALGASQLQALTQDQISALAEASKLSSLDADDIRALGSDITALSATQVAAMNVSQLGALTSQQADALASAGDFASLAADDILALSADAIDAVPGSVIVGLGAQASRLTDAQAQSLTSAQIDLLVPLLSAPDGRALTKDVTPTVSGTYTGNLPTGSVIAIYDGSTKLGNAMLGNGTYTFTPINELSSGPHNLTAQVEVPSGNKGTSSAEFALSIDTTVLTLNVETMTANVAENTTYSATAPTLSGTPIGAVTYTLTGADAGLFTINSTTGAVSMVARNFEGPADGGADNVYNYNLVATDAEGNKVSQAVSVAVTDVIEVSALTLTTPATANVAESAIYSAAAPTLGGTPIGAVTYTLTGADAGLFTVSPTTGAVTMIARNFDAPADVGADNVYKYSLVATDADGNTASQAVEVTVTNVNQVPSAITLSSNTISENITVGTGVAIGALLVTDPDASGNNNVLSLSGTDAASFSIVNGTLVFTGSSPNFEAKPSYSVTVTSTDGDLVKSQAFTVNVTNVNEAPTAITLSANTISENISVGTGVEIGALDVTDPDASGNNNVLSLSGTDAASFSIVGGTLMFTGASPNFELKPNYSVTVDSTDGALVKSQAFVVNVANVNEAPTVLNPIADKTFVIGGAVDTFTVAINTFADEDAGTTLTYSAALASGTALPTWLSFDAVTRTFSGNPTEAGTTNVRVTASDGSYSVTDDFAITSLVAPSLSTTLGGATSLDVRSKIVFSVGETVTAKSGGVITLTDLGGAGYMGENMVNTQIIDVTSSKVTIVGTGANTKIIVDPGYDLDLAANYSLSVSTGAFQGADSSQDSVAFSSVNFSTVTPGSAFASAVQAQSMNTSTGALENSLKWFDITNLGIPTAQQQITLDFSSGDYATVVKGTDLSMTNCEFEGAGFTKLVNFGRNDLFYVDNQINTNTLAQASVDGANFAGGVGTTASPLSMSVGGTNAPAGGNYIADFVLDAASLALLPADIAMDQTLPHVLSTNWSNTGMIIAA